MWWKLKCLHDARLSPGDNYEIDNTLRTTPEVTWSLAGWQSVNYKPFVSGEDIIAGAELSWRLCQWVCGRCQGWHEEYLDYNMCIIAAAVMTCHCANYKIMDHFHLISAARNSGYQCRICAVGRQKLDRYITPFTTGLNSKYFILANVPRAGKYAKRMM